MEVTQHQLSHMRIIRCHSNSYSSHSKCCFRLWWYLCLTLMLQRITWEVEAIEMITHTTIFSASSLTQHSVAMECSFVDTLWSVVTTTSPFNNDFSHCTLSNKCWWDCGHIAFTVWLTKASSFGHNFLNYK